MLGGWKKNCEKQESKSKLKPDKRHKHTHTQRSENSRNNFWVEMYLFNYELVCLTTWLHSHSRRRSRMHSDARQNQASSDFWRYTLHFSVAMVIIYECEDELNRDENRKKTKPIHRQTICWTASPTFQTGTIYLLFHFICAANGNGNWNLRARGFNTSVTMSDVDDVQACKVSLN